MLYMVYCNIYSVDQVILTHACLNDCASGHVYYGLHCACIVALIVIIIMSKFIIIYN